MKLFALPLSLLLATAAAAQPTEQMVAADFPDPMRLVVGSALQSAIDPAIRIAVPDAATYVGAVRWPLYGVADAEVHVFVEEDGHGLVKRLYWIQFEQYLPSKPDAKYDYRTSNPRTVELDGYTMHVDAHVTQGHQHDPRPGSDGAAVRKLVADAGFRLPTFMGMVRFVNLFEPTERKELMLIYAEDMDPIMSQMATAQMRGETSFAFADIDQPLIERAKAAWDLSAPE